MSEDALTLQGVMSSLEGPNGRSDDALISDNYHCNLLKKLKIILKRDEITAIDVNRALRICSTYSTDLKCIPYVLAIINLLVSKEMAHVDYLQSALITLEILRLKCIEREAKNIRTFALQILLSHSKATLSLLVSNYCPVLIETFGVFLRLSPSNPYVLDIKMETFVILKLMKILPSQELTKFVKEGIPLWLSCVVPTIIKFLATTGDDEGARSNLQLVDSLVDEMIKLDYFEYPEWQKFLKSVVDPRKIPTCIKGLLENGKDTWHVIWIMIIKLLKNYVTRSFDTYGTPINSMLPVVETAFKMDSTHRVHAFACWNELIQNFSNETNPNCIGKRVKLLVVPLRLNNAKTEDAAQAKLNTWWFLIRKFKPKLDKFTNEIIVPFLQFILGKEKSSKPIFWAGQLPNTRKMCLEAFVEIVGHNQLGCQCVIGIPHLNGKIVSTRLIIDHWSNWVCALKAAIRLVSLEYHLVGLRANLQCIWMSFVLLTAELPDNSVRRDLFNELINVLKVVLQDDDKPASLPELIVVVLVLPLFKDNRIKHLLNSRSEENRPMHKFVAIFMDKSFDDYWRRHSSKELRTIFDPIVQSIVNESVATPAYMIWLLDELPKTNGSMKLWTLLAQTVSDTDVCLQVFNGILRWPLKTMHDCTEVKEAAIAWYTLYNIVHIKLENIGFDNEITKIVMKTGEENKASVYFTLFALIGVLKHKPDQEKMAKLDALTNHISSWAYKENEQLLPSLVDALVLIIEKVSTDMNETLAQSTINCVQNIFIIIKSDTECSENVSTTNKTTFSQIRENIPPINKTVLVDTLISAMKTFLLKCSGETIKNEIRYIISSNKSSKKTDVASKEFASPKLKDVKKKKKEPKIVNTFVENGEVYVEVKSNWKFNPKNLTENQKEKLQMKRDNIPALYQDLSQSQDEFKLTSWKADSQDTSLSSSKSATSNSASEILKNMPSADVVPKIMENFLDKNTQQNVFDTTTASPARSASNVHTSLPAATSPSSTSAVIPTYTPVAAFTTSPVPNNTPTRAASPMYASPARITPPVATVSLARIATPMPTASPAPNKSTVKVNNTPSPKSIKSPRMALKDRVFRNVRNLIEKSSLSPENADQNRQSPVVIIENMIVTSDLNAKIPKNILEKHENSTSNEAEIRENNEIVVTSNQNDLSIKLDNTPTAKTIAKEDLNITKSTPSQSIDRPSRMKRKPKKYDNSLLLDIKKKKHSTLEALSDSQYSQDNDLEIAEAQLHIFENENKEPEIKNNAKAIKKLKDNKSKPSQAKEITVAQIHISDNDMVPETEKSESADAIKQSKNNKPVVGNGIVDKDTIQCDISQNEDNRGTSKLAEAALILSPTTPIVKIIIEKSPEKPTTVQEGDVPDDKNNASDGNKHNTSQSGPNVIVEVLPLETTPMHLINNNKSLTKNVDPQTATSNKSDTITTPLIRTRKAKASLENSTKQNKLTTVVNSPNNTNNLGRQKSLPNVTEQNATDKNVTSNPEFSTPKTKYNKLKDVEDQQKSAKKSVASMNTNENNSEKEIVPINKTPQQSPENNKKEIVTTTPNSKVKDVIPTSTAKKTGQKSLIEKQLRIDTVEGHPLLKIQSEKRLTRKQIAEAENKNNGRKTLKERLDKSKSELTPKTSRKAKENTSPTSNCITVEDSQDRISLPQCATVDDPPCSEDIIESSQDSTITTISAKSKPSQKRLIVALEIINVDDAINTQDLIQDSEMNDVSDRKTHEATDIELSQNKTAEVDKNTTHLTENMDTEPMEDSGDMEILNDTMPLPVLEPVSEVTVGPETQELAEADTQPNDPNIFLKITEVLETPVDKLELGTTKKQFIDIDITQSLLETPLAKTNEVSSPFKDDDQRKQDFLNNTIQISPIKVQSPEKVEKSLSPETSSDFVVVRLASPVHCNGEPYEKHGSPEFFSEDKRNASPPRPEPVVTITSPNSSLSLKKNRPQVRPNGRAAHMLGLLCVNDDKIKKLSISTEPDEVKKTSIPAKRNLRILYNSGCENSENCEQSVPVCDDTETFLKLSRALPTVTSSPSGPILKRKLADITDEATTSPASKRKRVSFHDPPVSTTISVQKYIDSLCHSPQSSKKRVEKPTRLGAKSPKRLENAFILDTVLSNAVESFAETTPTTDDTQNASLDVTPAVEVIITSDLNDTNPICLELVDCKDPIDAISLELSSPAMRELLVKELEGKIETIGDLARMTELEVNRLCIKAPKIQVAKKVLAEYAVGRPCAVDTVIEEAFSEPLTETLLGDKTECVQSDAVELRTDMQVDVEPSTASSMVLVSPQTDEVTTHTMQNDSNITADIIPTCLSDRQDLQETLNGTLNVESEMIPGGATLEAILEQEDSTPSTVLKMLLDYLSKNVPQNEKASTEISFLTNYMSERYEHSDLITFCIQLLQKVGHR